MRPSCRRWALAEESLASYVRDHCAEGVLVQALHTDTLRLEVAIRFSGPGRDRNVVRDNLRKRTVLQSLPGSTQDWKVDSKVRGQAEDARLAVYESLRGRTMPQSPGGWRLVLDRAPRGERLPACSLIAGGSQAAAAAAPGPAGGVKVGGGCGAFSAGGRAGPAASDTATFFSVTIAVKPPERRDREHQGGWIEKITGAVKTYATKNTTEGLLVQSVAGGWTLARSPAPARWPADDSGSGRASIAAAGPRRRRLRLRHDRRQRPAAAGR